MNRRGAVGIAALWILVGCSALAYAVIAVARSQMSSAKIRLEETQLIHIVASVALTDRENNFADAHHVTTFQDGRVETIVRQDEDHHQVRWTCHAESGDFKKDVEIGWIKNSGRWRADYWKEL